MRARTALDALFEGLRTQPKARVTQRIYPRPPKPPEIPCEPISPGYLLEVSEHADMRIKERTSLRRKAVRRLLNGFYDKRIAPSECTKDLRAWVEAKLRTPEAWSESGIIDGVLWIIARYEVVTVIPVPREIKITTARKMS